MKACRQRPLGGSTRHWYFEASNVIKGYPIEAHFRPARDPDTGSSYWPADSSVSMNMATSGVSGGGAYVFNDSLTLRMNIGDAHISTVDCAAERMTVKSNGVVAHAPFLTSCGIGPHGRREASRS